MRTEEEMYALILNVAKNDPRIRGVILNGSRANPNAPKDSFQDFDIVYLVKELDPFIHDQNWIDLFGPRLMLQMPETMRYPTGNGRFNWLMLFQDGNRLDLSLAPLDQADQVVSDSQSIVLLDKDGFGLLFPLPVTGIIGSHRRMPFFMLLAATTSGGACKTWPKASSGMSCPMP